MFFCTSSFFILKDKASAPLFRNSRVPGCPGGCFHPRTGIRLCQSSTDGHEPQMFIKRENKNSNIFLRQI